MTEPAALVRPRRGGGLARREAIACYLFIAPAILCMAFWQLGPMLAAVWFSLNDWDLLTSPRPIGLRNFAKLLVGDPLFWQSLRVTTFYTLVTVPLNLVVAFLLALMLNLRLPGMAGFRTIYYLPSIVPQVANAVLWSWIFNAEFGILNLGLRTLGLPKIAWLQSTEWVMPALWIMGLWSAGAAMVIYLAGLQGIPEQLYEAAEVDGANWWHRFWAVTIPMMSPVIFFNLVMGIIFSFQVFTAGYLITDGGPANASLFYVLYLYRNAFTYLQMGYAAALAWVLFFIVVLISLLVFRYIGRMVYYEESS